MKRAVMPCSQGTAEISRSMYIAASTIPPAPSGPLAVSPAEAGRLAGVGRTTIYAAISSGELRSLKIGTRRLVAVDALRKWLLAHEVVQ